MTFEIVDLLAGLLKQRLLFSVVVLTVKFLMFKNLASFSIL